MKPELSVSIVIPNWNGLSLLKKHLSVVIKNSPGCRIIVVDDCSTDSSVSYVQEHFPDITVVRKPKNEGFASTVNAGVQAATSDIIVLLNTDIEPEKDFLDPLISHFSDTNVFAVGCMDKSMENGNTVLRGRGIGRWERGFYIHKRGEIHRKDTAWVSGGSGAFRRSMWNRLGGMDPLFNPFYWEDIDLSYRARKAGWKILFDQKSVVLHLHEEGVIKGKFDKNTVKQIAYRNQFLFIWKNCSDTAILLSHLFWTAVRIFKAIIGRDIIFLSGFVSAIIKLPAVLFHRISARKYWKISDTLLSQTS